MEELQSQINKLNERLNFLQPKLFDIQGTIRTVTATPTTTPTKINDQILIYMDSVTSPTDKRLYIYSPEAGIWSYVVLT